MRYLILIAALFFSFNTQLFASEASCKTHASNEFLARCSGGILSVVNEKAYLHPDRLHFYQNRFFLLNDSQQWISLTGVSQDISGYYVDMQGPECPNGHIGIYRVKKTWYCAEEGCRYSIYENFLH
jgi:hypothetical protein